MTAIVVACLLLGGVIVCARWGWADLAIADAMALENVLADRVAKTGEKVSSEEAQSLLHALQLARQLEPGNPLIAEQVGQLRIRGLIEAGWFPPAQPMLTPYLQAVRLRPTSGYAWANLSWAKYHAGQVDDEFYRAFAAAMRFGPWEPEVQMVALDLGLALWDEMSEELRQMTLGIARNAQRRYSARVLEIAQRRGRTSVLCATAGYASAPDCKAFKP